MRTLDPTGGVIFEVGNQHVLLSAKALSSASLTFTAMFKRQNLEGQNLSSKNPPVIALPEDRYQSFELLLSMVQHQRIELSEAADLLDVCLLAERGRCIDAVKSQMLFFMYEMAEQDYEYDDPRPLERYGHLFIAAYILRDHRMMKVQTRRMALYATPGASYLRLDVSK